LFSRAVRTFDRISRPHRMMYSTPGTSSHSALDALPRLDGWVVERALSAGAQAETFLVHRRGDASRRRCVAKLMRLAGDDGAPYALEEQWWRFRREVTAIRSLGAAGCPGIVTLIDSGHTDEPQPRPWYVMPYYAGGAMRRPGRARRFAAQYRGRVDRVLEIAGSLAGTLGWMHAHAPRCVHRDVHTQNVFFPAPGAAPVLGDFGIAHLDGFEPKPESAVHGSGAWFWRPPELDQGDHYSVTPAADVFMLGGLIYEALSGGEYLPAAREWGGGFPHEEAPYSLRRHTMDVRLVAVDELLRAMFAPEPTARLGAAEVALWCRSIVGERRQVIAPRVYGGWSRAAVRSAAREEEEAALVAREPQVALGVVAAHLAEARGLERASDLGLGVAALLDHHVGAVPGALALAEERDVAAAEAGFGIVGAAHDAGVVRLDGGEALALPVAREARLEVHVEEEAAAVA
jgi:hypothetical protein